MQTISNQTKNKINVSPSHGEAGKNATKWTQKKEEKTRRKHRGIFGKTTSHKFMKASK